MRTVVTVSLRQRAVFIPQVALASPQKRLGGTTPLLVANLAKLGYGGSEPLLVALNRTTPAFQAGLLEQFRKVMGVDKNWTPLVRGWDAPAGEGFADHLFTFFANVFGWAGIKL